MRLAKNRVFRAAAFGMGLILTGSLALAGEATFRLPVETHIGNVTLSPGEYRISTPASPTAMHVVYLYGNGKVQATFPANVGVEAEPGRSYLELVKVGDMYFVDKYNAGVAGQTFTFEIPKKFRREAVAKVRVTATAVGS